MAFTPGAFRAAFPEFADTVAYPDAQIDFWAGLAQAQLPETIWKTQWLTGVYLYTAHELVLARQNQKSAAAGGVPGQSGGIANTKTVGSVSVGYDSATSSEKDAGWWNLTNYGKQLYRLIRIFGAGCVQL
jgi:uncharacterized protein YjlB